ncbi:MAG: stealth family protein [Candidatus Saccharibacteria bacterium]|nr:stealth family protein [Candidatus Saccharibacteria bacterium]
MKTSKRAQSKIDFVVLWVDSSDKEWRKEKEKYTKNINDTINMDNRSQRYRDWENFQYWFRGVEKFAPWVNKVHLVTCGHTPTWLNTTHPKLNIVKHSDFMPANSLPTFNSNAIELCIHKIPGLSEQFVLFNDDMFLTKPVKPTDFFKNGRPVNTMALFAIMPTASNGFYKTVANNLTIIDKYFSFDEFKKKNLLKILSIKQCEWIIFTYPLLIYNRFVGFRNYHIAISYMKKTFSTIWEKEPDMLMQTVNSRVRDYNRNVSHWLCNYWQFASGNFEQRNAHFGTSIAINDKKAQSYISRQKYHILCLNDVDDIENPEAVKREILRSLNIILPEKSTYEA